MLDKKSIAVLKVLDKLASTTAYKVVTTEDVLANLSQKNSYDIENIKQTIEFLEKQEYINVKFSEENTYCYSLLPKARIFLEQEANKKPTKKKYLPAITYLFVMLASFVGTISAMLIFFYLTF